MATACFRCKRLKEHPPRQCGLRFACWLAILLGVLGPLSSPATDTNVITWGSGGVTSIPNLPTNAIAITGGDTHGIALLADRTMQTWGAFAYFGGSIVPPPDATNIISIAAGSGHALAVRSDGRVILWGRLLGNSSNQVAPEATNVVAVGVGTGAQHALALRADGTVVDWGLSATTDVPPTVFNIVSVAAGAQHSLALRSDGRVIAWGQNAYGQTNVPANATNIVDIATTWFGNIAIRADGTPLIWGIDPTIPPPPPLTNFVEAAGAGGFSGVAMILKRDGTVLSSSTPPATTNIMTIGASRDAYMAVKAAGPPIFPLSPMPRTVVAGSRAYFRLRAVGMRPLSYQWSFQGTNLPAATNAVLVVTNAQANNVGSYVLTVSNSLGIISSSAMMLNIEPLEVIVQPLNQTVLAGSNAMFTTSTVGQGPFSYQWKMNGTNLLGATQSTLSLTSVTPAQAGVYSVEASNNLGTASSQNARLAVVPLFITTQPQNQIVVRYAAATLTVTAGGTPSLKYQWRLNGTNLPGATSSAFTIPSMQAVNEGTYSVAITNDFAGLISSNTAVRMTSLATWGANICGQFNVPANATNLIGIAAGSADGIVLKSDGTVVTWGCNDAGQTNVPPDLANVVSVLGGYRRASVLKADGTALGWGLNTSGENNVPANFTNGVQIAGIIEHLIGLKADGTAVGWGYNAYGVADVPAGLTNLVSVAAGRDHSAVLRADGTVIAWGYDAENRTNVPPDLTNAVAIACGGNHTVALRADGTVTAWGSNAFGQTNLPAGLTNVVAIACGPGHSLALKSDGSVVAWGDNAAGQTNVPTTLTNVVAIAAGDSFSLALVGDVPPISAGLPVHPEWSNNTFRVSLPSLNNRVYRLEYKNNLLDSGWVGLPLMAGTGGMITLTDATASDTQRFYRVRKW